MYYLLSQFWDVTLRTHSWSVSFCHTFGSVIRFIICKRWFPFKHLHRWRYHVLRLASRFVYIIPISVEQAKVPRTASLQRKTHQPSYRISDVWILQEPYSGLIFMPGSRKLRFVYKWVLLQFQEIVRILTASSFTSHLVNITRTLDLDKLA